MPATAPAPRESLEQRLRALEETQRATLNILEDFDSEKARLEAAQQAALNILEDFEAEKAKVAATNVELSEEVAERKRTEQALARHTKELARSNAELEQANQTLRQRTSELQAVNAELETFTYSVSHDLRAPLRHVDGFSRILVEEWGGQLDPAAHQYLQRIRAAIRQMAVMVDELLHLARVGRQELRQQVTGLNSLVEEVLRDLKPEMEGRQIEWRIGSLPFVDCDPGLMKQVFANLLSNAVKYTRPRPAALIEVDAINHNGQPAVFVRDNGVGFSMKYADKLFGVFQRLHRAEDFEGTGVGLATVQRILQKHGGRIWAHAELDKGATFYFTLGTSESIPAEEPAPESVRGEP